MENQEIRGEDKIETSGRLKMKTLSITKEELLLLRPLQYEGKITMIDSTKSLDNAIEALSEQKIIGIDTESRPAFRKGEYHPTSLVQLAANDIVFLIRIQSTGFSDSLVEFFENGDILKIGIAIRDDLIDLKKIRKFKPSGFHDLNVIAHGIGLDKIGAKNLSGIFLSGRISKSQQTSNWENRILTPAQKIYAATDAWICLKIYEQMLKRKLI
ncbi:MAG: 3'-5' exonuclease domain-containing protein 2 [Bacteroidetes bacterium]|nr:3'-5' exonuclease domain-containing protein 2 [Bacteroidota bacterium]MDA1119025.1 3'-5' exonuclease domain-containing protein 2 [Bacteroidota bacterium]